MIGNIPKNLIIVTKKEKVVNGETVIPSFVVNSENLGTLETARRWANHYTNWEKRETLKGSEVSRENRPMDGYRLIDLERRDEGGRAYKVVSPEGYYVDLREDVLLDTIKTVGISPGGLLNGKYLFATLGSQMRLVREGSDLHAELINATTNRSKKKLTASQLEVGEVYENLKGEKFVFGGFVDTKEVHITEIRKQFSYGYDYQYEAPKVVKKAQLWIMIPDYLIKDKDLQEVFNDNFINDKPEEYEDKRDWWHNAKLYSEVVKNKSVVNKVGQLDKNYNYIKLVKDNTRVRADHYAYDTAYYSMKLNMVPTGEK